MMCDRRCPCAKCCRCDRDRRMCKMCLAQGKEAGSVPARPHNKLRCKNGDHDECLRAQLASTPEGGVP